jgi:HSP20 family protein
VARDRVIECPVVARIFLERRELPEEIRRLFEATEEGRTASGTPQWTPEVDVLETESAFEIVVDVAGVEAQHIDVLFSRGTLLITGRKEPQPCQQHETAFHLAERSFGRFTRVVRLAGAYDAGRAQASLSLGELRIVVPRIEDRRGRHIRIPVRG